MTAKAKYPGQRQLNWPSTLIELAQADINDIREWCPVEKFDEFIQGLVHIIETYLGEREAYSTLTTAGEDLATLRDLAQSSREMMEKLRDMPCRVSAMLHKQFDDIRAAEQALQMIWLNASFLAARAKPPKGGRTPNYAANAAANSLKALFDAHGLPWSYNTWSDEPNHRRTSPALEVLELVFLYGDTPMKNDAIASYVKKAGKKPVKN